MDEVRVVRRRTHIWPIVIALIILAIVVVWAFFAMDAAQTEIGARAALYAIVTRELVALEKGRGVEHEALGILVDHRQFVAVWLVGPGEDLSDGLEDVG